MKRLSEFALLAGGVALMVVGGVLMFMHQYYETKFQAKLLETFGQEYHWRPMGDASFGVSAIAVGAVMVTVSAILEAVMRRLEVRHPRG